MRFPRVRGRLPLGLRSGVVVIAVVLAACFGLVNLFQRSPSLNPVALLTGRADLLEVRDTAGFTQARALENLRRDGFRPDVRFVYSTQVQRGTVVATDPPARDEARRGSRVVVSVSRGTQQVRLANLVGTDATTLAARLAQVGLVLEAVPQADELIPKDRVIAQTPAPDTVLRGGATVRVVVSQGPERRKVPDVTKQTLEAASYKLGLSGLALGEVKHEVNDAVAEGVVISTDPPVNAVRERGDKVNVVVSDGPAPAAVPQVVGQDEASARQALEQAGLVANVVTYVGFPNDGNAGKVRQQSPAAGATLDRGGVVTIEVIRSATGSVG